MSETGVAQSRAEEAEVASALLWAEGLLAV